MKTQANFLILCIFYFISFRACWQETDAGQQHLNIDTGCFQRIKQNMVPITSKRPDTGMSKIPICS